MQGCKRMKSALTFSTHVATAAPLLELAVWVSWVRLLQFLNSTSLAHDLPKSWDVMSHEVILIISPLAIGLSAPWRQNLLAKSMKLETRQLGGLICNFAFFQTQTQQVYAWHHGRKLWARLSEGLRLPEKRVTCMEMHGCWDDVGSLMLAFKVRGSPWQLSGSGERLGVS